MWTSVSTLLWNCQLDPNLPLCISPGWSRIWRMLLPIRISRMPFSSARELRFLAIVLSWLLGKKDNSFKTLLLFLKDHLNYMWHTEAKNIKSVLWNKIAFFKHFSRFWNWRSFVFFWIINANKKVDQIYENMYPFIQCL